jgi:hypothetical protein
MDLDVLARCQHGVLSAAQAREGGLTRDAIAWRVASGRWRRLGSGVYVTHTAELTWWARAHAALLQAGDGAALSLGAAAFVHGLSDRPPPIIVIAIPTQRRRVRPIGVRIRRRRRLEVVVRRGLTVTTAAQTVIDLAAEQGASWREAVNVCARAVQARRVSAADLESELAARGRHPHRRVLQVALGVVAQGAETAAEVDYVHRVERAHGLPPARLQAVAGDSGRRIRRDAEYLEWGVVVEIDGAIHLDPRQRALDVRRDRGTVGEGKVTLRITNVEVCAVPCELAVDIVRALRHRGFRGRVHPCRAGCPLAEFADAA